MKILFVCKHNRFRSKVAEALFRKLNKKDEVKSAGIFLDIAKQYVCENVKIALKKRGIENIDEKARELNDYDLDWADKIIVVANNVNKNLFPENKTEIWNVGDADENEKEKIEEIVSSIERKLRIFLNK